MKGYTPFTQVEYTDPNFFGEENVVTPDPSPVIEPDPSTVENTTEEKYEGLYKELEKARKKNQEYRLEKDLQKRNTLQDTFQFGERGLLGKKYQKKKRKKEDSYRLEKSIRDKEEDRFVHTEIEDGGGKPRLVTHLTWQKLKKDPDLAEKMGINPDNWTVVGKKGTGIHPAEMKDKDGNPSRSTTWKEGYVQRQYYVVPKESLWKSEQLQKMRKHYSNSASKQPKSMIEEDFGSEYIMKNKK